MEVDEMHLIHRATGRGPLVVGVGGEIDVDTAAGLRRRFAAMVRAGCVDVVVDLREVTFIDSTGFGALVTLHQAVRARGGRMRLVVDRAPIGRTLRVSGLDRLLEVHETLDAALDRARPG